MLRSKFPGARQQYPRGILACHTFQRLGYQLRGGGIVKIEIRTDRHQGELRIPLVHKNLIRIDTTAYDANFQTVEFDILAVVISDNLGCTGRQQSRSQTVERGKSVGIRSHGGGRQVNTARSPACYEPPRIGFERHLHLSKLIMCQYLLHRIFRLFLIT